VAIVTVDGVDDLDGLRAAGLAVAEARDTALAAAAPGVSTADLDALVREVLDRHGARSAPQLAYGFPGTSCIGLNERIAQGVPSADVVLADGDLINVDVSAELDGYWADTGASAAIGTVHPRARRLVSATRAAQRDGMHAARAGRPLRDIAKAVQRRAQRERLSIVANLCGHGVGRHIHEPPSVPSVDDRNRTVLWEGLVLAIEPFLALGATHAVDDGDGWTLRTNDRSLAAQFEHTVVVTAGRPLVLTASVTAN
jgi:methionyl aminopeptidase